MKRPTLTRWGDLRICRRWYVSIRSAYVLLQTISLAVLLGCPPTLLNLLLEEAGPVSSETTASCTHESQEEEEGYKELCGCWSHTSPKLTHRRVDMKSTWPAASFTPHPLSLSSPLSPSREPGRSMSQVSPLEAGLGQSSEQAGQL